MGRANDQTLLDEIIRHEALPLPLVKQLAREIIGLIREGLMRDGVVNISNFGAFRLKSVAARGGTNPHTGERLTIAAHQRVIFTPCKALREQIEPHPQPPVPLETVPPPLPTQAVALAVASAIQQVEVQPAANSDHIDPSHAEAGSEVDSIETIAPPPERAAAAAPSPAEAKSGELEIDLGRFEAAPQRTHQRPTRLRGAALVVLVLLLALLLMRRHEVETDNPAMAVNSSDTPSPSTPTLRTSEIATADNTQPATPPQGALAIPAATHRITQGDTLWHLAASHYHEPLLWPHIYQANRDTLTDPDQLRTGAELTIPALQGTAEALSASDRFHIAEGYYLTYRHYQAKGDRDAIYALLMAKRYDASVMSRHLEQLNLTLVGE